MCGHGGEHTVRAHLCQAGLSWPFISSLDSSLVLRLEVGLYWGNWFFLPHCRTSH